MTARSSLRCGGTPEPALDVVDRLIAALAVGDADAALAAGANDPALVDAARQRRPSLIVDAVAAGRSAAVELLLDVGFDVNQRGRADLPANGTWETPLHVAARDGRLDLAQLLVARGADPTIRDGRFDATPLGWAEHFEQAAMVDLLGPLTPT